MNKSIEDRVKDIVETNELLSLKEKSEIICLIECYKGSDMITKQIMNERYQLQKKIDIISNFISENKIKRYRPIEGEEYEEEICLDVDDIDCLERIINDEYDYENR